MSDAWIPVDEEPAPPAGPPPPAVPTARRGRVQPIAGGLEAQGAWLVRPSLWASLDVFIKLAVALIVFASPVLIGLAISGNIAAFLTAVALAISGGWMGFFYALLASVGPVFHLAFTRYTLDGEGIHVRTQILSKSERRVQWEKVTLLQQRRTLVDRLFRIERLDVVAYGEKGATLHLVGLRETALLRNEVARRMRENATVGGRFASD